MAKSKQFPEFAPAAMDALIGDTKTPEDLAALFRFMQKRLAERILAGELLERDARGEHVVEYRIAAVYEVLGEHDEAVRWLDKQIADADGLGSWLLWLNHDPVWSELRKDRRWNGIQTRAGW